MASWNVAKNKYKLQPIVEDILRRSNIDILALHEVNIRPEEEDIGIVVSGYNMYAVEVMREKGVSGVVSKKVRTVCLVREKAFAEVTELTDCNNDRSEVWLRLKNKHCKDLVYSAVYSEWDRSSGKPGLDNDDLLQQLKKRSDSRLYMHGDFNTDVDRVEGGDETYDHYTVGRDLIHGMESIGLDRHSCGITRRLHSGENLQESAIDWAVSNIPDIIHYKRWMSVSDHAMIISDIPHVLATAKKEKIRVRSLKNLETDECVAHFNHYDWFALVSMTPGEACAFLQRAMTETVNVFAPLRWVTKKPKPPRKPTELEKKARTELFHALRNRSRNGDVIRNLRRRYQRLAREARVAEMDADLSAGRTDMWSSFKKIVKSERQDIKIMENGKTVDGKRSATMFLDYFTGKVRKLKENCSPVLQEERSKEELSKKPKFYFRSVSEDEILGVIRRSKPSRAEDKWGITPKLLKTWSNLNTVLIPTLRYIINQIIEDGEIPAEWKVAKIFPNYKKKGNKHLVTSYRPISICDPSSKILEGLLNEQIVKHMTKYKLVPDSQHGYRRKRSTVSATTHLSGHIDNAKRDGSRIAVLCFDYSAAFDCVDGDILGAKLKNMGFLENAVKLVRSYMTNRTIFVEVGDFRSEEVLFESMAPQGSKISPTFYLLLASDLHEYIEVIEGCHSVTYADDTNVVVCADNMEDLKSKMEQVCDAMARFSSDNGLSLNPTKTEYMLVQRKSALAENFSMTFGGTEIQESTSIKFLGIHLSKDLQGRGHLDSLKLGINGKIAVIRKLRHYFPRRTLYRLIEANISSRLFYAIECWLDCTSAKGQHLIDEVDVLIKHSIRAAHGQWRGSRVPSETLWEMSGLVRTRTTVLRRTAMAAFEIFNPQGAWGFLRQTVHHVADRERRCQYRNLAQVDVTSHSLVNKAARMYNVMPQLMRSASNEKDFKKLLNRFVNNTQQHGELWESLKSKF